MKFEIEDTPPPKVERRPAVPATAGQTIDYRSPAKPIWQLLRWISRLGVLLGLGLYVYGTFFVERFDKHLVVEAPLLRDPQQEPTYEPAFPFEYQGHQYKIQPVASYEISGLVVTHNDISSIADAYHTSESVDFRDVCLVWGSNVTTGAFRGMEYWSMPWSCHFKPRDRSAMDDFDQAELSNNHLLAADEGIRNTIRSMRIGDQVQLRGKLINYWQADYPEFKRKSSLTREDTGDGACEVLWVEEATILRKGKTGWFRTQTLGQALLIGAVLMGIFVFLFAPLGSYRRFRW